MKRTPERTCLGCGAKQVPQVLLRLVCSPQGEVLLDHWGRAPGRGAYTCGNALCLRKALKPTKLVAAFKRPVMAPTFEALCVDIAALFQARLETCLQLAYKAGVVVSGYAALQRAFVQRQVVYVVLATDIAATRAEAYRAWCECHAVPYICRFSKEELGRMMGKPSRSAVGFTDRRFVERLCMLMTAVEQWRASHSVSEERAALFYTAS